MKKVISFAILICLGVQYVNAVPANPKPKEIKQPNGTSLTVRLIGDEYYHYIITSDGLVIEKNSAGNYEYVDIKADGTVGLSGVLANDEKNRTPRETDMVRQLREKQVKQKYIKHLSTHRDEVFDVIQPDNTTLRIKRIENGDNSYTTTEDGLIIEKNKNGFYEYLTLDKNNISLSGIEANDIERRSAKEKEFIKTLVDKNTKTMLTNRMAAQNPNTRGISTKGRKQALVILMEFPDRRMSHERVKFYRQFNEKNYNGTGSVRDFFGENSYGQLWLNFDVVGPYMAKHNMAYYGEDKSKKDQRVRDLIDEAVHKANGDVDFSSFDADYDNIVDFVHIIYAGYGQNYSGSDSNTIWPHQGTMCWFWSIFHWLDGKMITKYSCSNELSWSSGNDMEEMGTTCHELGHILGAPDFYDTSKGKNSNEIFEGTGDWDLMASGGYNCGGKLPAHFNPFIKTQIFGWAKLNDLPDKGNVTLRPASTIMGQESFYKLPTSTPDEYFILENRQWQGLDKGLPGHGLMIYHVHSDMKKVHSADVDWINTKHPQKFYPVSAGAKQNPNSDPQSYNPINFNCTFGVADKNTFTSATTPSAVSWAGVPVDRELYFIREEGDVISLIVNRPVISGYSRICGNRVFHVDGLPNGTNIKWGYSTPEEDSSDEYPFKFFLYRNLYYTPNYKNNKYAAEFIRGYKAIKNPLSGATDTIPYTGYANIYADIEYPQNTITPQNKRKDRLSNRVYVGNLDPAISICNKDHQSLGYFYTDTDYLLEAKFDKHELEDITEIMWEVSTVYPQSPTSYKYIFLGQSNPFSVTSIPNEVCQVIQAKVQYKTNDCGQTEWFSREFTFHNKNPYTMNFTNPAFEYTIVSVYEGSEDNGRDISVNKTLYNGEYELELWSDFCKIQSIKANTPSTRIPLSGLTDGIYYIRLIINKQTVSTSPIIVKH